MELACVAGLCNCVWSSLCPNYSPHPLQTLSCLPGKLLLISSSSTLFSLTSLNVTRLRCFLSWDPPSTSKQLFNNIIFLSPKSVASLAILAPCRFLNLTSFSHLRAFILSFPFRWSSHHYFALFISLLRDIVGEILSDFPVVYRNSCHLFFFMLRCVCIIVVFVVWLHWNVSSMQACLFCSLFYGVSLEGCPAHSRII